MGYVYSLDFTNFEAVDNNACLAEIERTAPDIGDGMFIRAGHIVFEPEDSYAKWHCAEDTVIDIIARHIKPGTTCKVYWEGEDGEKGGTLVGRNKTFQIVYEPFVVTENGNIPLHQAERMLTTNIHYISTWDYSKDGEQKKFCKEAWRKAVADCDTVLGYQDWVNKKLAHLLNEIDLNGVDSIEVAGCSEDGFVDVTGGQEAQFYFVSIHKPDHHGTTCVCDFNTKDQAFAFAEALAARQDLPVLGNCCSIDE